MRITFPQQRLEKIGEWALKSYGRMLHNLSSWKTGQRPGFYIIQPSAGVLLSAQLFKMLSQPYWANDFSLYVVLASTVAPGNPLPTTLGEGSFFVCFIAQLRSLAFSLALPNILPATLGKAFFECSQSSFFWTCQNLESLIR